MNRVGNHLPTMHPPFPDSGFISDIYHVSKRGSFEAKKRGESDQLFKFAMAATLVYIGCKMGLDAFQKTQGGRGR